MALYLLGYFKKKKKHIKPFGYALVFALKMQQLLIVITGIGVSGLTIWLQFIV